MDKDREFSDFVAGHWPRLLRAAVLLGCALPEAEDVAQATLVRCYTKWHLVARAENRAAYAAAMLINVHRESRRRRSASEWRRSDPGRLGAGALVVSRRHLDGASDHGGAVTDRARGMRLLAERGVSIGVPRHGGRCSSRARRVR